jgi:hypothetical protein
LTGPFIRDPFEEFAALEFRAEIVEGCSECIVLTAPNVFDERPEPTHVESNSSSHFIGALTMIGTALVEKQKPTHEDPPVLTPCE